MSAVAQRFAEPLGVLEEVGAVLEDGHGLLGLLDVVEEFGILLDERENGVPLPHTAPVAKEGSPGRLDDRKGLWPPVPAAVRT